MALTHEEIVLDFWANAFLDDPKLREQHVTDDYEGLMEAMEAELAELGSPQELLRQRMREEGKIPAEQPEAPTDTATSGNVTVTQEVVSLGEGDIPNDWEDVVDDRYGNGGSLS